MKMMCKLLPSFVILELTENAETMVFLLTTLTIEINTDSASEAFLLL